MHIYVFLTNFCGQICLFRISVRHPVKRDPPRSARFLSVSAAPPLELAYIMLYKHIYAYQTKLRGKNRIFWTEVRLPLKRDPAQAWLFSAFWLLRLRNCQYLCYISIYVLTCRTLVAKEAAFYFSAPSCKNGCARVTVFISDSFALPAKISSSFFKRI